MTTLADNPDLAHHGDLELAPGLVDLAVNVLRPEPPPWLRQVLAESLATLAAYPDPTEAETIVAARHNRPANEVLMTAGAAEAFVLLARAVRPAHAVIVHPQFTEPEVALRAAGHQVDRVMLDATDGFRLHPEQIPASADLVIIGNPTNPTSVLHPAQTLRAIARPGRMLVVDEAFMDAVPGEPESLAADRDIPGLLVIRSLTKMWGLAGLRIGYAVGEARVLGALSRAQPLWAVSSPALAAAAACFSPRAQNEAMTTALQVDVQRAYLLDRLSTLPQLRTYGRARAPFVLVETDQAEQLRLKLRERGIAVRRGDTFPGLGPDWLRIAVRPYAITDRLIEALSTILG
jgi:histidinol-phosphate aminotransferase